MKTLMETLWSPRQREPFAADLAALVDQHLAKRSGMRGIILRSGLAMAQAAKPDLLNRALARLTPEFIAAIEPLYDNFHRSPDRDFSVYLQKHGDAVRAALLGIADAHATASRHATLRAVYQQLRGFADEELRLFTPALGRLICGYL